MLGDQKAMTSELSANEGAVDREQPDDDRPANYRCAGKRELAKRGLWPQGNPPIGYDLVTKEAVMRGRFPYSRLGKLIPNKEQAELVSRIFRLYLRFGSTTKTAAALTDAGFRGRKGGLFRDRTIHCIITNPVYIGRA